MPRVIAMLTLVIAPSLAAAQRLVGERAGVAPLRVELALPARVDTASRDSLHRPHTRLKHVLIGSLSGLAVGAIYGRIYASDQERKCLPNDDLCGLDELNVPFFALIGLVSGTIVGAVWPTH